jgi:hypothetical protein
MKEKNEQKDHVLESNMLWKLLLFSFKIIFIGVLAFYLLLVFKQTSIIHKALPSFLAIVILLPFAIQFASKGTLAQIEFGKRQGISYYFWTYLWQFFFLFNIIVIILIYKFKSQIGTFLRPLINSNYFYANHFIILLIISMGIVGYTIRYAIKMEKLDWDMLDRLKTISIVSPAYCFGGAILWSKVLSPLGVKLKDILILAQTSIISGILFLLFLFLIVLFRPQENNIKDEKVRSLVDSLGNEFKKDNNKITYSLFFTSFIVAMGISLFFCIVLDAAYLIIK